jgi:hypothetical protein
VTRRIRRTCASVAAVLMLSLCIPLGAQATNLTYWSGLLYAGQAKQGPRHTIYSNFGQTYAGNQYLVGVWARNTDGSMAGSKVWGNGTVSHAYCQCALRYPWVQNDPITATNVVGIESY